MSDTLAMVNGCNKESWWQYSLITGDSKFFVFLFLGKKERGCSRSSKKYTVPVIGRE